MSEAHTLTHIPEHPDWLIILHQQQQAVSSPNPLQQADQEYEEVVEPSENVAYKPVQSIKMKKNEAYQFVGQYWLSNTSECGILRDCM